MHGKDEKKNTALLQSIGGKYMKARRFPYICIRYSDCLLVYLPAVLPYQGSPLMYFYPSLVHVVLQVHPYLKLSFAEMFLPSAYTKYYIVFLQKSNMFMLKYIYMIIGMQLKSIYFRSTFLTIVLTLYNVESKSTYFVDFV